MSALKVTSNDARVLRGRWRRPFALGVAALALVALGVTAWVGVRGMQARSSLTAAVPQVERLTTMVLAGDRAGAQGSLAHLQVSTQRARDRTSDPVWRAMAHLPWLGANLGAVATVAAGLDDLADTVLPPVVTSAGALDPAALLPVDGQFDLASIQQAAPDLTRAVTAMRPLAARVAAVRTDNLLAAVAEPVGTAQDRVRDLAATLQATQTAATLLPTMLGADGPRTYLLMLQSNAELRATGGMPGALSVLTADEGRITLTSQSSAGAVYQSGVTPVALTSQDEALFSDRMGIYMADVNFTPDFPVAAGLATQMWQQYSGVEVDGVIATDPVALSYLLAATGPVDDGAGGKVTTENAVDTLLSGAYARFPEPADQDTYFAAVAANVFTALVDGRARPRVAVPALARAAREHRLLVWSSVTAEQSLIATTSLSGDMAAVGVAEAPSAGPRAASSVGVFFNDGTGSKMDYYLNTAVTLLPDCLGAQAAGASATRTVRVHLANDAPVDAAQTLGASVTGNGAYGAARGEIETSVVLVGPADGAITGVTVDGLPVGLAAHSQSTRPATVITILLAPGESAALEVSMRDPAGAAPMSVWSTPTKDQPGLTTAASCA